MPTAPVPAAPTSKVRLPFYQVDAFSDRPFSGNPAAVCPLQAWLPDSLMQAIAAENNLSETAFFVRAGSGYHIRWFTPTTEVALCGHATLASAHILFTQLGHADSTILFTCKSGALAVTRHDNREMTLDLPREDCSPVAAPAGLAEALGAEPQTCLSGTDLLVVLDSATTIASLRPDFARLRQLPWRGILVTAAGDDCDLVCRFFAPGAGIDEDPVTGSAFTQLVPYWAEQLGKTSLSGRQLSARGGFLQCQLKGKRVLLRGSAVTVIQGEFMLD